MALPPLIGILPGYYYTGLLTANGMTEKTSMDQK